MSGRCSSYTRKTKKLASCDHYVRHVATSLVELLTEALSQVFVYVRVFWEQGLAQTTAAGKSHLRTV